MTFTLRMMGAAQLAAALVFCASSAAHAATAPSVKNIKVRLFLKHSGVLGAPLNGSELLWNVVAGGGDSHEPASSALVDVVVRTRGLAPDDASIVRLQVTSERTGRVLERHSAALRHAGPASETHVGFWLPSVGCEPLKLEASVAHSVKTMVLPFQCGE